MGFLNNIISNVRNQGVENSLGSSVQSGNKDQNVSITDVIAEGPIRGLVGGTAGIYLDNVPLENAVYRQFDPGEFANISFNGSSSAGTVTGATIPDDIELDPDTPTSVEIQGFYSGSATLGTITSASVVSIISLSAQSGTTFTSDWNSGVEQRVSIIKEGAELTGSFVQTSSTQANLYIVAYDPEVTNYESIAGFATGDSVKVQVNAVRGIQAISASSITIIGDFPTTGDYQFSLFETPTNSNPVLGSGQFSGLDTPIVQFRSGTPFQAPIETIGGVGGAVNGAGTPPSSPTLKIIASGAVSGVSPIDVAGLPEDDLNDTAPSPLTLTSTNFGLGQASKRKEADEINFAINYQALQTINQESGGDEDAHAHYLIRIRFKNTSSDSFGAWENAFPNYGGKIIHKGNTSAARQFDHYIGLNQYRPFHDFEVQIIRLTRHSGLPVVANGTSGGRTDKDKWLLRAESSVGQVGHTIKDIFNYPYTSLASIGFSSKTFQRVPKRSYLIEGKMVQVPTSYTPREYSSDGIAKYEEFWDGGFKEELQYTDNPAWVFYDMMTNKRYGAGQYIQEENIDKYALYRIAKYCDELVDNGNGGTEPRFRANLFLQKETEVYKVAKDMATMFLGILYWMDSKLIVVNDAPQDPVYTFTKGNVLESGFSYESTGARTKVNQVVVTYNDPDSNYEPVAVVVEDRNAISRVGRIVSTEAVAFGATSEAQALRYGRWKLWTSQNQTEVISFVTGLQGAYIRPGDIVNVQDADRYGVVYSGRIKSGSAAGITLDRSITLNSGSQYYLNTFVNDVAAFLNSGSSVTIGATTYQPGDKVTSAYVYDTVNNDGTYDLVTLDSESAAANAFVDSAGTTPLSLTWKPYSYVLTKELDEVSSTSSYLVPTSIFTGTEVPTRETIWSLSEEADGVNVVGSTKQYKVLGVKSEDRNTFAVSAVEHYNSKFAAIETDYYLGSVPDSVFPTKTDETLPTAAKPKNLRIFLKSTNVSGGDEFALLWDINEDQLDKIAEFEIAHNLSNLPTPIRVSEQFLNLTEVPNGEAVFRVRSVGAQGEKSAWATFQYLVDDPYGTSVPRVHQIPSGVLSNVDARYSKSSGKFSFDSTSTTFVASIADPSGRTRLTAPPELVLSGSSISAASTAEYYVYFDKSESSISLKHWDTTSLLAVNYWRDANTGDLSVSQSADWTSIGTVTVAGDSNILQGTSLCSSINLRDVINLSGSNDPASVANSVSYAATVISIQDDTTAVLDRTFESTISSVTGYRNTHRPDYSDDGLVSRITYSVSQSAIVAENSITVGLPLDGEVITIGENGAITIVPGAIGSSFIADEAILESNLSQSLAGRINSNSARAEAAEAAAQAASALAASAFDSASAAEAAASAAQASASNALTTANSLSSRVNTASTLAVAASDAASAAETAAATASSVAADAQSTANAVSSTASSALAAANSASSAAATASSVAAQAASDVASLSSAFITLSSDTAAAASAAAVSAASASTFVLSAQAAAEASESSALFAQAQSQSAANFAGAALISSQSAAAFSSSAQAFSSAAESSATLAFISSQSASAFAGAAATSANSASASRSAAEVSAQASASSATIASTGAGSANQAATAANTSANSASASRSAAAVSAGASASSAQVAQTSRSAASAAATAANLSATSASAFSTSAQDFASASQSNAQLAEISSDGAASSATAANISSQSAAASRSGAEVSATAAQSSANIASIAAGSANQAATAANISSQSAGVSRSAAQVSAAASESNAQVASVAAGSANQAATAANTSANSASASRSAAAISAGASASSAQIATTQAASASVSLGAVLDTNANIGNVFFQASERSAWSRNPQSYNLQSGTNLISENSIPNANYFTDSDATFGNAYIFFDSDSNETIGPRKVFPWNNDTVYFVRVIYRVSENSTDGDENTFLGYNGWADDGENPNNTPDYDNIQPYSQTSRSAGSGVLKIAGFIAGNSYNGSGINNIGFVTDGIEANQSTAHIATDVAVSSRVVTTIGFQLRQNAGGDPGGRLAVKSFEIFDVTAAIDAGLEALSASGFATAANVSANSASVFAASALVSAEASASSAQIATTGAASANQAATAANVSANSASASRSAAAVSAGASASSAQVAQTSRSAASAAATAANLSANSASAFSASAQDFASASQSNAQVAEVSASSAASSATAANLFSQSAAASRSGAEFSATAAQSSATVASIAAGSANQAATAANISSQSAGVSRSAAAVSAAASQSNAQIASIAAGSANEAATAANTSANSASASRSAAGVSAGASASSAQVALAARDSITLTNILPDGDFELQGAEGEFSDGWDPETGRWELSTACAHRGSYAAKITSTGASDNFAGVYNLDFPIATGDALTLGMWVLNNTGGNVSFSLSQQGGWANFATTSNNTWTFYHASGSATADYAAGAISIDKRSQVVTSSTDLYIDEVVLVRGTHDLDVLTVDGEAATRAFAANLSATSASAFSASASQFASATESNLQLAEVAAGSANQAATAANISSQSAAASRSGAAVSATAAQSSAQIATAGAEDANSAAVAANTFSQSARASRSAAGVSAAAAQSSATVASTNAGDAESAATAANLSAVSASASRSGAALSAGVSESNAQIASIAAGSANQAATAANLSVTSAAASASSARVAAEASASSATVASTGAQSALTAAGAAATSESNAAASESAAGVSASASQESRLAASAASLSAQASASSAFISRQSASSFASQAESSAQAAVQDVRLLQARVTGRGNGHYAQGAWLATQSSVRIVTTEPSLTVYENSDIIIESTDSYSTYEITLSNPPSLISATGPIYVTDDSDKMAAPNALSGTVFADYYTRNTPRVYTFFSERANATVSVYTRGSLGTFDIDSLTAENTFTVPRGGSTTFSTADLNTSSGLTTAALAFISDAPIIGSATGTSDTDGVVMVPLSNGELVRNSRTNNQLTVRLNGDTGTITTVTNGSAKVDISPNENVYAFANGIGDGNGSDSEVAISRQYLSDFYMFPRDGLSNYRIVSLEPNDIVVTKADGTVVARETLNNATEDQPVFSESGITAGSTNFSTGGPYAFSGTAPFFLVAQSNDSPTAQEITMLGALQGTLGINYQTATARQLLTVKAATDSASAEITSLVDVVATNSAATVSSITVLEASISSVSAAITTESEARATASGVIASQISTLTTSVSSNTTSIQTSQSSIDGLEAQYTVKIDNNDHVSGFGLASTSVSGTVTSAFIVRADKFAVVDPASNIGLTDDIESACADAVPFVIEDGITKIKKVQADAITAQELEISANTSGNASSMYFSASSSIRIYDSGGNLRVHIGNLDDTS